MKYTAITIMILGATIACLAGIQYAIGGPPGEAANPSTLSLVVLLAFAAALGLVGAVLWVFGGKGFAVSRVLPAVARPESRPHGRRKPVGASRDRRTRE